MISVLLVLFAVILNRASVTMYPYIQYISFELTIIFGDDGNITVWNTCNQYFGTRNNTLNTLESMDHIFYSILKTYQNSTLSIITQDYPETELHKNESWINCLAYNNVAKTTTSFAIAIISNNTNIVHNFFIDSINLLMQYFSDSMISVVYSPQVIMIKNNDKAGSTITSTDTVYLYFLLMLVPLVICNVLIYVYYRSYMNSYIVKDSVVLLIGVEKFDGMYNSLPNVRKTINNLTALWRKTYNYRVFVCQKDMLSPSKADIVKFMDQHLNCIDNEIKCVIVHIASHGSGEGSFLSSDLEEISLDFIQHELSNIDVYNKRSIIKLVFFHGCMGDQEYYEVKSNREYASSSYIDIPERDQCCSCISFPNFCNNTPKYHSVQNPIDEMEFVEAGNMHEFTAMRSTEVERYPRVLEDSNFMIIYGTVRGRAMQDSANMSKCIRETFENNSKRIIKYDFHRLINEMRINLMKKTGGAEILTVSTTLRYLSVRFEVNRSNTKLMMRKPITNTQDNGKRQCKPRGDKSIDDEIYKFAENNEVNHPLKFRNANACIEEVKQDHDIFVTTSNNIVTVMRNINNNSFDPEEIDIKQLLNDFLYFLTSDDNKEIESIYTELCSLCDINKCLINQHWKNQSSVKSQILRKIHCLCAHSYQIGHRFTLNERSLLELDDLRSDEYFRNKQFKTIDDIVMNKCNDLNKLNTTQERMGKYKIISLLANSSASDNKCDKIYHFGTKFHYELETKYEESSNGSSVQSDVVTITPVHGDIKEEITQNKIKMGCLSVNQYNTEYQKAKLHFESDYRKKQYSDMAIQHILSIMIYCNFDNLSAVFSETYWKTPQLHKHYYHFGRFLKAAVHEFGTPLNLSTVNRFYHGMIGKLPLPAYVSNILIYCPLSTSSSPAVAVRFAQDGLVIELGAVNIAWSKIEFVKQLSVAWLSDFPGESEHLFIQNEWPLQINDIIDTSIGKGYAELLHSLRTIDNILNGQIFNEYSQIALTRKIIEHQLSTKSEQYRPFKSLLKNPYGTIIVDTYFNNKKILTVNYANKSSYMFLHDSFLKTEYEWINIVLIAMLFSNIELIKVENVQLSSKIFDDILEYLKTNHNDIKLPKVSIKCHPSDKAGKNKLSVSEAISTYNVMFMEFNLQLIAGKHNNAYQKYQRLYIKTICEKSDETIENASCQSKDTMDSSGTEFNLRSESDDKYKCLINWFANKVSLLKQDNDKYVEAFIQNGYDTMELIQMFITRESLKNMDIVKEGHVLKIMSEVNKL
eukprot:405028_1